MEPVLIGLITLWIVISAAGLAVLYRGRRGDDGDGYRYGPDGDNDGSS